MPKFYCGFATRESIALLQYKCFKLCILSKIILRNLGKHVYDRFVVLINRNLMQGNIAFELFRFWLWF